MNIQKYGDKKLITFGNPEEGAVIQAKNCLYEAEAMLLMADNHKGYGMPVGGVAVYRDKICPAGVGFDIACGNKAVKLSVKYSEVKDKMSEFASGIQQFISFGVGRKNKETVEHGLFDSDTWNLDFYKDGKLKDLARAQLGTVGSGNHYVDVFVDDEDFIWIGVHFGSRGLGHKTATNFLKLAGDNPNIMDEVPHTIDPKGDIGEQYNKAMKLCGEYAYAGRDWVCDRVARVIGGEIIQEVHNHHNFAWEEEHNGQKYWVVRKGATPAFSGQLGFVGSSMGGNSVIIEGVDTLDSKEAYYSTVHGAGRIMSRTMAAGKAKWMHGKQVRDRSGVVHWGNVKQQIANNGTILLGGGADEAPECYKNLREVLVCQGSTIKVLHQLRPLIVCMAGIDEFDPYKD